MINFNSLTQMIGPVMYDYGKRELLSLGVNKDSVLLNIHKERFKSINEAIQFELMINDGKAALYNAFLLSQVFSKGPKVFNLGELDWEALEQIDLNINLDDYNQPFETVVFELPLDYCEKKRVACPDKLGIDGLIFPENHCPIFAVIFYRPDLKALLFGLYFSSSQCITSQLPPDENLTIEEQLLLCKEEKLKSTLTLTKEESEISFLVAKACLNACLLIDDFGLKKNGPKNPSYYNRLLKNRDRNAIAIRTHPILYSLSREVKLREIEPSLESSSDSKDQRTISPHFRRGHYRQQRFGPGLTEKKRVRILPVLVNADLLLKDQTIKTTYK